jgi:hypothetical protein
MRTATRIVLFVAPLLVVPVVALCYTHLNIDRRLFVERFGCGCPKPDGYSWFNTNHLTLIIAGLLLSGTASTWWFAVRGLPRKWFWLLVSGFVVLGLVFFRQFMYCNTWL